jgi:hypothetical protein
MLATQHSVVNVAFGTLRIRAYGWVMSEIERTTHLGMRRYTMNRLSRKRLIDKLVVAYVGWREACARVNDAYRWELTGDDAGTEQPP